MTSFNQVKDFIITTDTNSNKNLSSDIFTFTSPAATLASGTSIQRTYTIPLSTVTRYYQFYINYSMQPGQYYSASRFEYIYDGFIGKRVGMQLSSANGSITLVVYLVNNETTNVTFDAFTINVIRRDFRDELL